jgi:hypothetical protein
VQPYIALAPGLCKAGWSDGSSRFDRKHGDNPIVLPEQPQRAWWIAARVTFLLAVAVLLPTVWFVQRSQEIGNGR